ncbi:MAG: hypothetical protein AAF609_06195 [Cyanobacteria bacterium P01_C01_bin.120]
MVQNHHLIASFIKSKKLRVKYAFGANLTETSIAQSEVIDRWLSYYRLINLSASLAQAEKQQASRGQVKQEYLLNLATATQTIISVNS